MSRSIAAMRVFAVLLIVAPALTRGQTPVSAPQSALTLLDALSRALLNNPVVQLQRAQVEVSQGVRMQASGVFDTTIQADGSHTRAYLPLPTAVQIASEISHETSDTTLASFGENRLFRNGVSVATSYSLERLRDTYTTPDGINASQLNLVIAVPLLRGRGRDAVAAQETAAAIEVEAALLDLNQTMAQLVTQTVIDYWGVEAAERLVAIARDSEARGRTYVDNVTELIRADHVPRGDFNEVDANVAERAANRIAAEQQLIAARGQLAVDVGQSAAQMTSLPEIAEPFPLAESQQPPSDRPAALRFYIAEALARRADILAARRRIKEASVLKVGAANGLLPQLNLNFSTGYVLANEGRGPGTYFKSAFTGDPIGPNAVGAITFSFPPANQAARGVYMQASGSARQSELRSLEIERSVASAMTVAVEDVRNEIERVKQARRSVQSFRAALEGEREKYRVGLNSVVDVLTVEDRLTTALSSEVQADQAYADSIVQFRFLTGTLIAGDQSTQQLAASLFSTLPFYAEPSSGSTP